MNDDFAILAAVCANPTHPYALLEHLETLGVRVPRSTLYRRVEALAAQGWLEADDIKGETGHYRRALALSKAGRARIAREAEALLRTEPLESPLFALAVAAKSRDGEGSLAATLRPRMAAAARRLTEEENALRRQDPAWSRTSRERSVAHLRADISWLQGLVARVAS